MKSDFAGCAIQYSKPAYFNIAKRKGGGNILVTRFKMPNLKSKKITVDVALPLYQATERAVSDLSDLNTTISVFVRDSLNRRLRSIERAKLERGLKEGYLANAALGDRISKEFEFIDAETAGQIDG